MKQHLQEHAVTNPFQEFSKTLERLRQCDEMAEAYFKEHQAAWKCPHERQHLVALQTTSGSIQYRKQCQECGRVTEAVKHASLSIHDRNVALCPDDSIRERFHLEVLTPIKKKEMFCRQIASSIRIETPGFYGLYMSSPEWGLKRIAALKASGGWCEHCKENPSQEVHHLNYSRLGSERPEDLMAVCSECHSDFHQKD